MDLFIAVILLCLIGYELYTGEIAVKNGARSKALSRSTHPSTYWFWVIVQAVIVVIMLLSWFNFIEFPI